MSGRKKYGTVSRSEYDDAILRNNVRADNRLTRELKDVERAQRVKFRDISFETKRIRSKIQPGSGNLPKSQQLQKQLLQMAREETMTAQARTSLLHIEDAMDDYNEDFRSPNGMRDSKFDSSLNSLTKKHKQDQLQINGKNVKDHQGRRGYTEDVSDDTEHNKEHSADGSENMSGSTSIARGDRRNLWDSLSVPKHPNNAKAVRERLQSEFGRLPSSPASSRASSQLPVIHGLGIKRDMSQSSYQFSRQSDFDGQRINSTTYRSAGKLN